MSGTLYFVDMNERSEYENGRQKQGEREEGREKEEKKTIICTYTERKNEKEKKVMFNIMPSLCSKVTSRRYHHLLMCVIHLE